jgi:hypothetical protein
MSKIEHNDWKDIVMYRERKRNIEELNEIAEKINSSCISSTYFYNLANSAKYHLSSERQFGFETIKECTIFLIKKFVEQGGRCSYLGIPIYPTKFHKYKVSIERRNPYKNYSMDNIELIVSGLNGSFQGQRNEEVREQSVNASSLGFNIDKLNQWTLFTDERKKINNEIVKEESLILLSLIDWNKLLN